MTALRCCRRHRAGLPLVSDGATIDCGDLTAVDLGALRDAAGWALERAAKATPGPWVTDGGNVVETAEPVGDGTFEGDRADVCEVLHYRAPGSADPHGTAAFIASARDDVPALGAALLAVLEQLEAVTGERDAAIAARVEAERLLAQAIARAVHAEVKRDALRAEVASLRAANERLVAQADRRRDPDDAEARATLRASKDVV